MNKWLTLLTKIHIHPLFWLIVAVAILTARFYELMILFFIVLIHELGHAVAAHFFSWRIKNIFLLPFGGALELEEHGNRPIKEEFIITIAGPIQHLWMMLVALFLVQFNFITQKDYTMFMEFNLMILFFNCLPILPLDGGKLVYLFLTTTLPFTIALRRAIILSFLFLLIYITVILSILPLHFNGWVIVVFLMISLYKEWKNRPYVYMRFLLEKYSGLNEKQVRTKKIYVNNNEYVSAVIEKFQRGIHHSIIVVDNGKMLGKIQESTVLTRYFEQPTGNMMIKDLLY